MDDKYMKSRFHSFLPRCFTYFVPLILVLLVSAQNVFSAEVTLVWYPNSEEDLAGYRVFCRQEGESYHYNDPAWEGDKSETSCTIYNLDDHTTQQHQQIPRNFSRGSRDCFVGPLSEGLLAMTEKGRYSSMRERNLPMVLP